MNGEKRRDSIIEILRRATNPVSGIALAGRLKVSRQVIVQDMALLRAKGHQILSTNRGYVLENREECSRVFKVIHSDQEVETELNTIVDLGGWVKDVFVYHKSYGVVRADLNIHSRRDIALYLDNIKTGKSTLLKNVTSGYHYHTVFAGDEYTLDLIQDALVKKGFLAKLQEYEPVNFWEENEKKGQEQSHG